MAMPLQTTHESPDTALCFVRCSPRQARCAATSPLEFIVSAREAKRNGLMVYVFGYLKAGARFCNLPICKDNHDRTSLI
jgi:hypothetical protein